ncbi:MAG: hypothetical protein NC907_03730 [Candidatus Omnitrophica bacterium]|nr:hypothetical protein [Candidatus Omnitrophota bacterium]MCM8788883.1 hypothetical protein [Candidatus Omnitrophota bacterium]
MRKFSVFSYATLPITVVLFILILCSKTFAEGKKPFSQWPSVENKIQGLKFIVAETPELAHQGFCGASSKEFQNTIIWFPHINEGTIFVNANPGFGTVNQDIQIVFLDRNWLVLEIKTMESKTGTAIAPKNTCSSIEGISDAIKKLRFEKGKPAPFRIIKSEKKYFFVFHTR